MLFVGPTTVILTDTTGNSTGKPGPSVNKFGLSAGVGWSLNYLGFGAGIFGGTDFPIFQDKVLYNPSMEA